MHLNFESGLKDKDKECCSWAAANECNLNPEYMRINCQTSCGTRGCTPNTVDQCQVKVRPLCLVVYSQKSARQSNNLYHSVRWIPLELSQQEPDRMLKRSSAIAGTAVHIPNQKITIINECQGEIRDDCNNIASTGQCNENEDIREFCRKSCGTCWKFLGSNIAVRCYLRSNAEHSEASRIWYRLTMW